MTDDINRVRAAAVELVARVGRESSTSEVGLAVEKAANALKAAAEMSLTRSEATKLHQEIFKLEHENRTVGKRERSERIRDYVTLLTPLLAVLTLAGTMWQFFATEQAKREQAIDSQWQDAVKAISQSGLAPGVAALQPFLHSGKYREEAKDLVVNLLSSSTDPAFFHSLFGTALGSLSWDDANRVLQIDRAVYSRASPTYEKTWDYKTRTNDASKLTSKDELAIYNYAQEVIPFISSHMAVLLKTTRPVGYNLDLSATDLRDVGLQGVDLRRANLSGVSLLRVNLEKADLSDITNFEGASFEDTAWWEAKALSPALLAYLELRNSYSANTEYGPWGHTKHYPREQYQTAMGRLRGPAAP